MAVAVPFLKNPRRLVVSNPKKKKGVRNVPARKKKVTTRKGAPRKTARRAYEGRPRPRRRRNPTHSRTTSPRRRRPVRRRRNPLLPGGMIGQMMMVAAGYLATPMLANMIPWQPASQAGEYLKRAGTVLVGSQILGKAVGRKFGNALFVGGMLSIAVEVLRNYVPALGGNALAVPGPGAAVPVPNSTGGVSYYFPPDAELSALYAGDANGTAAIAAAAGMAPGETVTRFANRF